MQLTQGLNIFESDINSPAPARLYRVGKRPK